jgi:hypothetical protein
MQGLMHLVTKALLEASDSQPLTMDGFLPIIAKY